MNRRYFLLTVLGTIGFCGLCVYSSLNREASSPRVSWRAKPAPPTAESCRDCHEDVVDHLQGAPHSRTLLTGDDPLVLARFGGKKFESEEETAEFQIKEGSLYYHHSNYPEPVKVDWVFGSGAHAMTPVSLFQNVEGRERLVQLRTSWYPSDELGPTLGQNTNADALTGIERIGALSDHAETMNCFGCHSTYIDPDAFRLTAKSITAGVGCERCHPGSAEHLQAVREGKEHRWQQDWSQLTAIESVNRCGGCHRRAEEMNPDQLTPEEQDLPRLASVGLTLSPCFQGDALPEAPDRLDCTTCHDPHQPANQDPHHYVAVCLQCHADQSQVALSCTKHPDSERCLECHMPKVSIAPHLKFTDHWIRIRSDAEQAQ